MNGLPPEREKLAAAGLLAALFVFYLVLGWVNQAPPLVADEFSYIAMADAIGGGDSRHFASNIFPPLYPVLLALAGNDIGHQHLLTAACYAFALLVVFFCLFRLSGNRLAAGVLTLAVALSPALMKLSFQVLSEGLYLLLSLLTLWLAAVYRQDETRHRYIIWAAVCCSLAMLTRSVAVVLTAAFVFELYSRSYARRHVALAIMLLPNVLWVVYKFLMFPKLGYVKGLFIHYYHAGWAQGFKTLYTNVFGLWSAWVQQFSLTQGNLIQVMVFLLLLLGLLGLVLRLRQRHMDGIYVTLYLGLLFIWPFSNEADRFLAVIFPLLLFYCLGGADFVWRKIQALSKWSSLAPASVLILFIMAPGSYHVASRLTATTETEFQVYKTSRYWLAIEDEPSARAVLGFLHRYWVAVEFLPKFVSPKDCVYGILPQLIPYKAGLQGKMLPIHHNRSLSAGDFPQCDYLLISLSDRLYRPIPDLYPLNQLPADQYVMEFATQLQQGQLAVALVKLLRPKKAAQLNAEANYSISE